MSSRYPEFPPGWAEVFGEDDFGIFAEFKMKGVVFAWRWIPPGKFLMGSPKEEPGRDDDEGPQHEVRITKGYWIGEAPVTQEQWEIVMGENPSHFRGARRPVEEVDWKMSQEFARRLSEHYPGLGAALPTEAQWEYACRAGTKGAFQDGSVCRNERELAEALKGLGWFDKNSKNETKEVKLKEANGWGLYDCHGNVWEWCRDAWIEEVYKAREKGVIDPEEEGGEDPGRVVRGGSWRDPALYCRAAFRSGDVPGYRFRLLGLRLSAGHEPEAAEPPGAERLKE